MTTPIEQFIQKLTELERTMTKGPWGAHDETNDHCMLTAGTDADGAYIYVADVWKECDLRSIAHLKNTNSTVIAMLKAVVELRAALLIDSSISQTTTRRLLEFDAHLNTLAAKGSQ